MYASPFDAHRFPDAPILPEPDNMAPETLQVLQRLRSTLPDPDGAEWQTATPVEKSTALARAIFDHEAARLTLDLPDDRMDLPIALHQDDPRLLQLLDTARRIRQSDPDQWPEIMDSALDAVQVETGQVMGIHDDDEQMQSRDLDNQTMPLYETIHEDVLDHRLEKRYQGILNPGTLASPVQTPWAPPAPGAYFGVLPVRPTPMPTDSPSPEAMPSPQPIPQPQPVTDRSPVMPNYQIREIIDPETQQVAGHVVDLHDVSQLPASSAQIWGMNTQNDTLPLAAFTTREEAQAHIDALNAMEPLREAVRNHEPVTIAGVPYEPDGEFFYKAQGQTLMPNIANWELRQYLHTGKLTPEMAAQQTDIALPSGHEFTPLETSALLQFAENANADPRFSEYRAQYQQFGRRIGGNGDRQILLEDMPKSLKNYVQEHRFDLSASPENPLPGVNPVIPGYDTSRRDESLETIGGAKGAKSWAELAGRGAAIRGDDPKMPENPLPNAEIHATSEKLQHTETGLHLKDLYLPDRNQEPMRVDAAFRESDFIRAFYNPESAQGFMSAINTLHDQRTALEHNQNVRLGGLQYVPAGVEGEYRATNAETGRPIDRQIIDRDTLHDYLHNGRVHDDLVQQWQQNPTLISPEMQVMLKDRELSLYNYASVADQVSRFGPVKPESDATMTPTAPVQAPSEPAQTAAPATPATPAQPVAADNMEFIETDKERVKDAPVKQEKTQEWGAEKQTAEQQDQTAEQSNQPKNSSNGKNSNGQGNDAEKDAPKSGGFSLFGRKEVHHYHNEPADNTRTVRKRDVLNISKALENAPLQTDDIHIAANRIKREGLTPETQNLVKDISERGQRDMKSGKMTPEQMQKNAHAMNHLSNTVNQQPDSDAKASAMEQIRKLGEMLAEAIKRIFSRVRGGASGPSM